MALPTKSSNENQPKVVQKLLLRTLVFILALGGLVIGIRWYLNSRADPERNLTADTVGWISAIEMKEDGGSEVVAIKPDLSIERTEGWTEGKTDRDAAWGPTGNFLYFVSDREDDTFHIYRWSPTRTTADLRTVGKRGRSSLSFSPQGTDDAMLMTSGGFVMEFNPSDRKQYQVLPPSGREIPVGSGDEVGSQSQFSALYGSIGTSFREARWCGDNDHIVAVMNRDEGDILIVQDMRESEGEFKKPLRLAAGERIEFDVNPANGQVIFTVAGFQWPSSEVPPEFVKDGRVSKPFMHYIGVWGSEMPGPQIVVATPDNKLAFTSPAVHPEGESFVVIAGPYENRAVTHQALLSFPARPGGAEEGKQVIAREIYEPSWDPTGRLLVYVRRDEKGRRTIYTANRDGSSERNITGGRGDFQFPKFSPQTQE